jgi:hypothetical protein
VVAVECLGLGVAALDTACLGCLAHVVVDAPRWSHLVLASPAAVEAVWAAALRCERAGWEPGAAFVTCTLVGEISRDPAALGLLGAPPQRA